MIRRPRRVGTATVVALVLLALCVVVIVSLIQRLSGAGQLVSYDTVAARLHGIEWGDPVVLIAGIVIAALGVLLLVLAVLPGRAVVVPMQPLDGSAAGIDRRSLRAALRRSETGAVPESAAETLARIGLRTAENGDAR